MEDDDSELELLQEVNAEPSDEEQDTEDSEDDDNEERAYQPVQYADYRTEQVFENNADYETWKETGGLKGWQKQRECVLKRTDDEVLYYR